MEHVVVMEMMKSTCVPSFISMHATVSENCRRLFVVVQTISCRHELSWKWCNTHAYQVSPLCVLTLESVRSKEVDFKEKCLKLFVVVYKHWFWCWWLNTLCIQGFVHISLTIFKLDWHMWFHYNMYYLAILLSLSTVVLSITKYGST